MNSCNFWTWYWPYTLSGICSENKGTPKKSWTLLNGLVIVNEGGTVVVELFLYYEVGQMRPYADPAVKQASPHRRRETQIWNGKRWGSWVELKLSVRTLGFKYTNIYFPTLSTVKGPEATTLQEHKHQKMGQAYVVCFLMWNHGTASKAINEIMREIWIWTIH